MLSGEGFHPLREGGRFKRPLERPGASRSDLEEAFFGPRTR